LRAVINCVRHAKIRPWYDAYKTFHLQLLTTVNCIKRLYTSSFLVVSVTVIIVLRAPSNMIFRKKNYSLYKYDTVHMNFVSCLS
jgi:hypothetical protein